jgi:hypothetical protein
MIDGVHVARVVSYLGGRGMVGKLYGSILKQNTEKNNWI